MRIRWSPWWLVGIAAVVGFAVAPSSWPDGDGRIVVTVDEQAVHSMPVDVGGTTASDDEVVALPAGAPTDATVEVRIDASELGVRTDALRRIGAWLELPDGSRESIPLLRVDDGVVVGARVAPVDASLVVALLAAVIVLWVSEVVPLHVAGLAVPVVLVIGGAASADAALAPFFNPIIVLFFGGFLLAIAMQRAGLDRTVAARLVTVAGGRPVPLYLTFLGTSAVASMWMSNTAAVALLLPIAITVTGPVENDALRRAIVLGVAYAATVGGIGSAIGTPANQLAIEFLDEHADVEISFVRWFAFGLPAVLLLIAPISGWVWWRFRPEVGADESARIVAAARSEHLAARGRSSAAQIEVFVVFVAVLVGWLTQTWHGVHPGIVALAGAVALMVRGRIQPDDLARVSWSSLLTFGGGLAIGTAVVTSGTADWIVTRLGPLADLPTVMTVLAVCAVTLGLTTVASNTASAATLIPLAIPLAGVIGVDPVQLVMLIAIVSSIDFALVIGTPPTMLAYDTGLFTARRIFSIGIVLDLVGLALVALALPRIWELLGIV